MHLCAIQWFKKKNKQKTQLELKLFSKSVGFKLQLLAQSPKRCSHHPKVDLISQPLRLTAEGNSWLCQVDIFQMTWMSENHHSQVENGAVSEAVGWVGLNT